MAEASSEDVEIVYTNYRAETSTRRIRPLGLFFGSTEWHPSPQWLLEAFDYSRNAKRAFALQEIADWQAPARQMLDTSNE